MIRVLLADDEAMVRAGIRVILEADPAIEVVGEAADGHDAVEAVRRTRPDVALLDIRMPLLDGLSAAAEIKRLVPEVAIMMLTTFSDDEYIGRALGAGADGFLLKSGDPRELQAGVHAVRSGGAYLSPSVARRVVDALGRTRLAHASTARELAAALTDRERQVLALVGTGLSNAEIAARLHVVEGTVKAYMRTVLAKTGARNRVEAALLAYKAGISP